MKRAFALTAVLVVGLAGGVSLRFLIESGRALDARLYRHIENRAKLDLFEDFQHGLDSWESPRPIGLTWSYDPSGLVSPGDLSFFKPSMHLRDYDVDAWTEVVSKGFGLVFRAAGPRNYHALRFTTEGAGNTASIACERYSLIDGKMSARVPIHSPTAFRKDQPCRLRLRVRGDSFSLYVREQLVDYWSDSRLASGGVGLFCGPGERVRVVSIRVSHQTDLTGQLCALVSSL